MSNPFVDRFRFEGLIAVIVFLLTLPTVYLVVTFDRFNEKDLRDSRSEQAGVRMLRPFVESYYLALEFRGDPGPVRARALTSSLESALARHGEVLHSWSAAASSGRSLQWLETSRGVMEEMARAPDPRKVQRLLNAIDAYLEWISDQSLLILDPDMSTYYLVDLTIKGIPAVARMAYEKSVEPDHSAIEHVVSDMEKVRRSLRARPDEDFSYAFDFVRLGEGLSQIRAHQGAPVEEVVWSRQLAGEVLTNLDQALEQRIEWLGKRHHGKILVGGLLWAAANVALLLLVYFARRSRQGFLSVIRTQQERIDASARLASLGEMAGGIGHEIASPLTVIAGSAAMLKKQLEADPERAALLKYPQQIEKMIERINSIIRSMKSYVRDDSHEPSSELNLAPLLEEIRVLTRSRVSMAGASLEIGPLPADARVIGHESEIVQVFVNLIHNAADAVSESPERRISLLFNDRGARWAARVQDTGPGVPAHLHEKIFESLFTTKPKDRGTGMGLAICRKILSRMGGSLELVPSEGGACFEVTLVKAATSSFDLTEAAGI